MILVDSSVWIDFFNGKVTRQSDQLDAWLGIEPLLCADLILAEVLQGFSRDEDVSTALGLFRSMPTLEVLNREIAIQSARNFRWLRKRGITVRKTVDSLIATACIENGLSLLHSDKDFLPFEQYLQLQSALPA